MVNYFIKWSTASGSNNHDLLRDQILNELNIDRNDIISGSIHPSISTPDRPFTVPNSNGTGRPLAREGHEMCISGGISFKTKNGKSYQSEELYYKDEGHQSGGLKDIFHYNCEVRLTDEKGDPHIYNRGGSIIEDHVISGASYIQVDMPPAGSNTETIWRRIPVK